MDLDKIIFKEKTFSSLLEEIYLNQKKKAKQIKDMIGELRLLISDIGDATVIVPLIKDYLDVSVRNDDQLVKVATIVQRLIQNQSTSNSGVGISEEEIDQLMQEIDRLDVKKLT